MPLVQDAMSTFRRKSGRNPLSRIHRSDVGIQVFTALGLVLPQAAMPPSDGTFIHVREQLRSHINLHVLRRLVSDHAAPSELRDTLFSIDLGV